MKVVKINSDDDDENTNSSYRSMPKRVLRSERRPTANSDDRPSSTDLDELALKSKWWSKLLDDDCQYDMTLSGKLSILAELLKKCAECGDKLLLFSTRLSTLDFIENYLEHWSSSDSTDSIQWTPLVDYCRIDGSTDGSNRKKLINNFNDPSNHRMRLFLISTKAGGIGINLVGANRVVLFDASWNVSFQVFFLFFGMFLNTHFLIREAAQI